MAVDKSKDLVMYFARKDGKEHRITVPDYKEGITDTEVNAGAKAIVTQDAFAPEGISLTGLVSAKRVDTTTTDVAVEEG